MLTTEDMTNVELFTELRDELSKAKGNMIYENDMPDRLDCYLFDLMKPRKGDSIKRSEGRFKPNGITDNVNTWRTKHQRLRRDDIGYSLYDAVRKITHWALTKNAL